jgi:pimeloyl-ACP methyl ester carboxylesterase
MLVLTLLGAALLTAACFHAVAAADRMPPEGPAALAQEPGPQVAAPSGSCYDGEQDSGAKYRICLPAGDWSDLIVYAHGYVASTEPVTIPEDQMSLPGFPYTVDQIATDIIGSAFATTSYYTNGLAVLPAISDLLDLVNIFTTTHGVPERIYLAGVSEGGIITALSVEQYPDVYDGGLAMCGPYGDFQDQINYWGDFRLVFDYFFPDLMPGEPLTIPAGLGEEWESGFFTETIEPVIADPASEISVTELMTVVGASPYAYAPPTSTASIEQLLWYNVFATEDGIVKLGGQPFNNKDPWRPYSGSSDDDRLNESVERISASQAALDEIAANYQTTGEISVPLVTLHTTGDEVVPYWHATQYRDMIIAAGRGSLHKQLEVDRHGHCAFGFEDILNAFTALVDMVERRYVFLPLIVRAP